MTGYLNTTKFVPSSGSALINGILTDTAWADTTIDIAFSQSSSPYSYSGTGLEDLPANFATVSTAQQSAALFALDMDNGNSADDGFSVEGFTNLGVNNLGNTNSTTAEIRFAETSFSALPTAMVGDFPGNDASSSIQDNGDVWFGTQYNYRNPTAGNYSWLTMIHEIGHALGLSHGHDSFEYGTLPSNYDAMEYSVMSYRSYVGQSTSGGYTNETYGFAQTFMMADIAALQHMYGADYTTNSGDTVYSWRPDSGNTYVNGEVAIAPGDNKIFATIWDGGGIDTYDLSAYSGYLDINLRPGDSSTFLSNQKAHLGNNVYAKGNIYNALTHNDDDRSLIENAIGGDGGNYIMGNQADNVLDGRGGDDNISGQEGNDTLLGGSGNDTLWGETGDDTLRGGAGGDTLWGNEGTDQLFGDDGGDYLSAGDGNDRIEGGTGNDTLVGGDGGDVMLGEQDNDALFGGNGGDHMDGGDGNDHMAGWTGQDTMIGGAGGDWMLGEQDNDALFGGDGSDYMDGGDGNDHMAGWTGQDTMIGGAGDDTMLGEQESDALFGGDGNDAMSGGEDNDHLAGWTGDDVLNGDAGSDTLLGEQNNDVLNGGTGNDTLSGGTGIDQFIFDNLWGIDTILDFEEGTEFLDLQNTSIQASDANFSLTNGGADTLITFDGISDQIILVGHTENIDATDLLFS
ncbi:M10 family metallopeptidase [Maritalea porphyrae]|uniref:Peptidase M10 serralysin C-terminal domain-containing protein n=1 Tax=Maritalea porphyrae TaxID=880732 RepID=A0ABQ5UTP7_9HYPH|nr:M10 family metallopeptidase [Maritalea porphyrae]GLQ18649.1 hypothetical protein GCM10007879_28980 [Maritalea porphyrae]